VIVTRAAFRAHYKFGNDETSKPSTPCDHRPLRVRPSTNTLPPMAIKRSDSEYRQFTRRGDVPAAPGVASQDATYRTLADCAGDLSRRVEPHPECSCGGLR
jgi:hypothetical protein